VLSTRHACGRYRVLCSNIFLEIVAMKPSWDDAPSWGEWLAGDDFGDYYWFEFEPFFYARLGKWISTEGRQQSAGSGELGFMSAERRP
jgi:hypothetical protein